MKNENFKKTGAFSAGEGPFLTIDKEIKAYAKKNNLKLTKNYHLWPERSFNWSNRGINKQIQIYLEKNGKNFVIWGVVYKDVISGKRYLWKQEPKSIKVTQEWDNIELELNTLKEKLERIKKSDLTLA